MKRIHFMLWFEEINTKALFNCLTFFDKELTTTWTRKIVFGNYTEVNVIEKDLEFVINEFYRINKDDPYGKIQFVDKVKDINFNITLRDNYISIGIPEDQLNQEEIEKIWKKLEEIYWELGGKGSLYAKVTDIKELGKLTKEPGFKKARFMESFPFCWRIIADAENYSKNYKMKVLLEAPFYKVEKKSEEHIFLQYYRDVFTFFDDENIDMIRKVYSYLAHNNNTEEERQAYEERLKAKKKEV